MKRGRGEVGRVAQFSAMYVWSGVLAVLCCAVFRRGAAQQKECLVPASCHRYIAFPSFFVRCIGAQPARHHALFLWRDYFERICCSRPRRRQEGRALCRAIDVMVDIEIESASTDRDLHWCRSMQFSKKTPNEPTQAHNLTSAPYILLLQPKFPWR